MADAPQWSIVVPTHNTRALTLACLDTLPREPTLQVVVVDDGSRDRTADAVRERRPDAEVIRHERPLGFTRAANRGLDAARGRWLLLLNSDTELLPPGLPPAESALAQPTVGIVGASLVYPDGQLQWSGGPAPTLAWFFALASGIPAVLAKIPGARTVRPVRGAAGSAADWVTGAALAMRREVWQEVGPMDTAFHLYAQDLDFCQRARKAGWQVRIEPRFRVLHHHGSTIAATAGSAAQQHPRWLWEDLLLWARKAKGTRWARRASFALRVGGRLRLVGRSIAGLWPHGDEARRRAHLRDSRAYRHAVERLRSASRSD